MTRRKQPFDETDEQYNIRKQLEAIADISTRNERVSWDRKMDNMVKLIAKIRPIEEEITDLIHQKQEFFDDITKLRAEMVKDCVHPISHLVHGVDEALGEYVECKFCNKRFKSVNDSNGNRT
jgi:hypothetical protein